MNDSWGLQNDAFEFGDIVVDIDKGNVILYPGLS